MKLKEIYNNGLLRVGVFIIVIITSIWFYNYSTNKKECEQFVYYIPNLERPAFGGIERESAHFYYSGKKFETRKEAIKYCISAK